MRSDACRQHVSKAKENIVPNASPTNAGAVAEMIFEDREDGREEHKCEENEVP